MKAQIQWAGHIIYMWYECIPEQLRFEELSAGKYLHVGQKKHYKDTLKASLKSLDIHMATQETLAQNCMASFIRAVNFTK